LSVTNSRTTFCDDPEDVRWLRETHLRGLDAPEFQSFVMTGNEDAPEKVVLYAQPDPNIFDVPVRAFVQGEDGSLH